MVSYLVVTGRGMDLSIIGTTTDKWKAEKIAERYNKLHDPDDFDKAYVYPPVFDFDKVSINRLFKVTKYNGQVICGRAQTYSPMDDISVIVCALNEGMAITKGLQELASQPKENNANN